MEAALDKLLEFLVSVAKFLVDSLMGVFPDSPFNGVIDGIAGSGVADGFAWLNWFVPVGQCLAIFAVWLTAAIAYMAISWVISVIQTVKL